MRFPEMRELRAELERQNSELRWQIWSVCSFGYEDHCTPASKEFGNRDPSQASAVPLPVMGLFHLMGLFYLMG